MPENITYDLVVIGGGFAGLTAALRAAELGCRVAVLEQGEEERYPCNSRFAGGIIHVAYNDVKRSPDELLGAIKAATSGQVSESVANVIAKDAGRLVDWLQERGARFIRFSPVEWHRWCLAPPRPLSPGLDWMGRGPDVLLRNLTERLRAKGGTVHLATRARSLRMAGSRCTGVVSEHGGREHVWDSSAVLVADGGFQGNAEMFRTHIGPRPDRVLQRGAGTGRGDGLRMAMEAGAATVGMNRFYGHVLSRDALHVEKLWPYPEVDAIAASGIVVGPDGRRLLDEGLGGIGIANRLAVLDDPACALAVFDGAIWDGPGKSARIPANPYLERAGGTIHRASSVEELASKAGLPADDLVRTVASHNAAVADGRFESLSPPRSIDSVKPWPIRQVPFMALPICAGITHTMGGIAVDGDGQVLRGDGSVIEGLFAAGAATGGLEGGGRVGYVGGLVKAGVLGLRAAERVSQTSAR